MLKSVFGCCDDWANADYERGDGGEKSLEMHDCNDTIGDCKDFF